MKPLIYLIFVSAFLGSLGRIVGDGEGFTITIFQALLVLAFSFWALRLIQWDDFKLDLTGLEVHLLVFLASICFSLIISANQLTGFLMLARFAILLLMILLVVNHLDKMEDIRFALTLIIGVSFGLATYSTIIYLLNPDIAALNYLAEGTIGMSRSSIGDDDPNFFAAMLFLAATSTTTIIHTKRVDFKIRAVSFIVALVIIAGIISTFSRSAWVSLFLALISIVILTKNYRVSVYMIVALPVLVLISGIDLTIITENLVERITSIFAGEQDKSSSMRIVLGLAAIKMFVQSYGLGVGFASFSETFTRITDTYGMYGVNKPHNVTYQVLSELGFIGLIIFLWILVKLVLVAYNNVKLARDQNEWDQVIAISLFSALIGYLTFHQFIPRFFTNSTMMITIALIFVQQKYLFAKITGQQDDDGNAETGQESASSGV